MAQTSNEASNLTDSFNSSAQTYERRIGSATRSIATHIVELISPIPPNSLFLDNACGTGAITSEVLTVSPDAYIHAVDNSKGMIDIVKSMFQAKKQNRRVCLEVMDGQRLRFENMIFDFSITNFGIFFFPDAVEGIRQIYRTLKVGGIAVVTCWKRIGILPIFYEMQKSVKPASPVHSMPVFEKWMEKETIEETLRLGGFANVNIEEKEALIRGEDSVGLVAGLVDNMKCMVGDQWSEDEKAKMMEATEEVLDRQGDGFCVNLDGEKAVRMVAWIALGRK